MAKLNPDQKFVVQASETLGDRLHVDTRMIAGDLAKLPSTVQHRLWLIIYNLLRIWAALSETVRPEHPLAPQYHLARRIIDMLGE